MRMHIPEELLEQIERGNALLFVGERMVRDALGGALIDGLTKELAKRCSVTEDVSRSFPEVAQDYEGEKGRQAVVQFICDWVEATGDEPQRAHRLVAGLTDCDVLVTTCFDRRLERAFQEAGRPLDVVIGNIDVPFEEEEKAQLYKIRGSIERKESLILTEDDYEDFFEDESSLSIVLQGYLARKSVLFLGYDLTDPHFKRLYRKITAPLDDYARRAYAFGEAPTPRVQRWCQRHGIEVLDIDVVTFLEELTQQLAARARPAPVVPVPAAKETVALSKRPYKLLDYYEAADADIFFGRGRETQQLAPLIHAHRLVLLYGASGTGKTSLLLAGVIPRLEGAEPGYTVVYVRPLTDPADVIRRSVARRLPDGMALPTEAPLVDTLETAVEALGNPLVLVLDQFEEFFIRLSAAFRQTFIAELGDLYEARELPIKVVLSLREDWLAQVSELEERIPEIFRTKFRLLPLSREAACQAITGPVERLGIHHEPALIDRLLDDLMGEGVMPPQLQLVCNALYESLAEGERTITLAHYERLGGTQGVLRGYLTEELQRFPGEEEPLARAVLEELITSQGLKAVRTQGELVTALQTEVDSLTPVLEKLVKARLLRPMEREEQAAYELAHEYLVAEIGLGAEVQARKQAEELIAQEVDNWQRFGTLLAADKLALIDAQRDRLRLSAEAQEFLLRSALRHGHDVGYWLNRMEDASRAVTFAQEALLGGAATLRARAVDSLRATVEALNPDRLASLVGALHTALQEPDGEMQRRAAEALWPLRRYLPGPLRLRLWWAVTWRVVAPAILVLLGILLVAIVYYGPMIWVRPPEIEWVTVSAGEFTMGSDESGDEQPIHSVYLDTFRIMKYEVTNAQYERCVRARRCKEPAMERYRDPGFAEYPVADVNWYDAQNFCRWIGGRLPTEAEWEKAASWDTEKEVKRRYPWGDEFDDSKCNTYESGITDAKPVGSYPEGASPYSVMDMVGNVWEWVADWYDEDYYSQSPPGNPPGPDSGISKVLRGGSWYNFRISARTSYRYHNAPVNRFPNIGFRCRAQDMLP